MTGRKFIISFAVAATLSFNTLCGVAEAKTTFFSILGDILGGVADIMLDVSRSSSSNYDSGSVSSGRVIKHGEISFDGSRNTIYSRTADAGEILAEQYFVLSYPAQIDASMCGKAAFRPLTSVTGMGGAVVESLTAGKDEEQKKSFVLGSGGYTVRTTAADKREEGVVSCELYFSKKDLQFNGIDGTNTQESAMQLMADVPVNDYFSCNPSQDERAKFYVFDMGYNGNINFSIQKATDICNLNCSLLNENGETVASWDEFCSGENVKSVYIPAGKYYLRVQQGNPEGGGYCLNIR